MKAIKIAITAMAVLFLTACSKDKKEIPEGLRLTVDGQEINFAHFTEAKLVLTSGIYNLSVRGTDVPNSPRSIRFGISSEEQITAKRYEHDLNHDDHVISMEFVPDTDYMNPYEGGLSSNNPMSITITSITATHVQGTFEGTVNRGATTKVITNGSFNLPLQ